MGDFRPEGLWVKETKSLKEILVVASKIVFKIPCILFNKINLIKNKYNVIDLKMRTCNFTLKPICTQLYC